MGAMCNLHRCGLIFIFEIFFLVVGGALDSANKLHVGGEERCQPPRFILWEDKPLSTARLALIATTAIGISSRYPVFLTITDRSVQVASICKAILFEANLRNLMNVTYSP